MLGSLVFARLVRRPLALLLSAGTLAIGAAYVGFAVAPVARRSPAWRPLVGGIGNGLQWPSLISIVQRAHPAPPPGTADGGASNRSAPSAVAIGLPLGGALVALSSPARSPSLTVGVGTAARGRRVAPSSSDG